MVDVILSLLPADEQVLVSRLIERHEASGPIYLAESGGPDSASAG